MVQTANTIWRDFVTDGVPASGKSNPNKPAIREWGTWVEQLIAAFTTSGGLIFETKDALDSDLAHDTNAMAWVMGDATPANNGIYRKTGASGAGSWVRAGDLPYSYVKLLDVGAGTADAIQLSSEIPTSPSVMRVAGVFEANTGNVTVSENGGEAKPLLTASGNQIAPAGLNAGMMIVYVDAGSAFRLLTDQASAAIQAAAEAARDAAEGFADEADASADRSEAYAAMLSADRIKFPDVTDLLADTIMSYAPGSGLVEVGAGDIIEAGGFRYKIASSGASDHHVASAGGVKLYVKPTITGKYNVLAFGAWADGISDDATIIQKALDAGVAVVFPKGDYKVNSTIVIPNAATLAGVGQSRTRFLSSVIGGSLFVTPSPSVTYLHLHGFSCVGNGLTGVDGNGHAINFIDPAIDSGTHTPQQCLVERVTIIGFRGQDVRDNSATKVTACGIIQVDGLHNTYRKVLAQECGVGFYFYRAQNSRVVDCVADGCDKAALLVMDCENLIATMNDVVNCGDGTTDANWPVPATGASVSSYRNEGFVFEKSKVKTPKGCPLIASVTSQGDIIQRNWLRPESTTDAVGQGVLLDRSSGFRVTDNTFAPTGGVFGRKAQCVTILATSNTGGISGTLARNTFFDVAGGTIEWNVKVMGNAAARTFNALVIEANDFGDNFAVSGASVVEADILLTTCTLNDLVIANNKFCAATNVTRTACIVQGASVTLNRPKIGPNSFLANGGTITANYSGGITETELTGSAVYDPPSLADAAGATTTVTVTGAALGDYVEAVSFDKDLQGITLTAYVSAANTVSVRLQNESGGVLDLASGTLRARVRKA